MTLPLRDTVSYRMTL